MGDWDPRKLPKVVSEEQQIPRLKTLCELAFVLLGIGWLLLLPRSPFLILGPAAALVEYAPVWRFVYVPMVLLAVATAILHVVDFVRPYRTRSRELTRVAINVASLFLMVFLSQAGDLFFPRVSSALPEAVNVPRVVEIINAGFRIGMAVAAVITAHRDLAGAAPGTTLERGTADAGLGPRPRRALVSCQRVRLQPAAAFRLKPEATHLRADSGQTAFVRWLPASAGRQWLSIDYGTTRQNDDGS